VHNNGVDKSREHERVANVGLKLAPLGDSSSHDSGGGGGEGKLKEPTDQTSSIVDVFKDKVDVTDEGNLGGISVTICKSITGCPESNSTFACIQDVLEHDVLDVLGTDRTGTKHGKTSLHEEDHCTGKEEVEHIESSIGGGDALADGGDAFAEALYGGHCVHVNINNDILWHLCS